ncbi:MAG: hypothetical protein R6V83_08495 [Candidatus Thorarchaeota archaeon]
MVESWDVLIQLDHDWHQAKISWKVNGPFVQLNSGEEICSGARVKLAKEAILDEEGNTVVQQGEEFLIRLEPVLSRKGVFARLLNEAIEARIYPEDTNLWYPRWLYGNDTATFFLHAIEGSKKYYLAVVQDGNLVQAHTIEHYEAGPFRYQSDAALWRKGMSRIETDINPISILNNPRPDWECLARITHGVRVNLVGETLKKCLNGVVPPQWPEDIREQLMAFLAYTCLGRPTEDPLDFFPRFQDKPLFLALLKNYYLRLGSKIPNFPYVRFMWQAEAGQLPLLGSNPPEEVEEQPWTRFLSYVRRTYDQPENVITIAKKLNKTKEIITSLPISRTKARHSWKSWLQRMMSLTRGLRLWPHVRTAAFGLQEIVYLGRAYRWPHKYLRFIVRIDGTDKHPLYFHHMVMPPIAAQQVKRHIPSTRMIAYSASQQNYHLYDPEQDHWKLDMKRFKSREMTSVDDLRARFGDSMNGVMKTPSPTEANILDYAVSRGWLAEMELSAGIPGTEINQETIKECLESLRSQEAIDIGYRVSIIGLKSIFLELRGDEKTTCSLLAALLESLPTCQVFLERNRTHGYALARISHENREKISESISSIDAQISMVPATAFRAYRSDFFRRLLKDDGNWDTDTSELLTQQRL